jgi:hypothetical protein
LMLPRDCHIGACKFTIPKLPQCHVCLNCGSAENVGGI